MAASVRSSSQAVLASSAAHVVTLPAGVQSGDVLVVAFAYDNISGGTNTASPSAGWTLLDRQAQGAGTNLAASLFWRHATGSDSLTITLTEAQEAAYVAVAVQSGGDPLFAGTNAGAAPATLAPVAVTAGDYLSLLFVGTDANNTPAAARTITPPSGYSNLTQAEAASSGSWVSMYALAGDALVAAATSIAPDSVGVSPSDQWCSFNVAIPSVESAPAPGEVFTLDNWKITLPTGPSNDATEVTQPTLDTYSDANFYIDPGTDRMVMVAPVQGSTTSGSDGTRCELREMEGGTEAAWSPFDTAGVRQLTVTMRVDPTNITDRQEIIIGQIHGNSGSPPIYLAAQWESNATTPVTPRIRVFKDGPGVDPNLLVGEIAVGVDFTYRIRYTPGDGGPEGGTVAVFTAAGGRENLSSVPDFSWTGDQFVDNSGWYFKAGSYNKSTVEDDGDGEAIVEISFLELFQPGDTEAHRFYLTSSPTPAPPGTVSSFWHEYDAATAEPRVLGTEPAGAPDSTPVTAPATQASWFGLCGQFVSAPASAAGTVNHTFGIGAAFSEDDAAADLHAVVHLRILETSVFSRIHAPTGEFPTTPTGLQWTDANSSGTPVDFAAGDRFIVEIGFRCNNTDTIPRTGTVYFGGTGSPDMAVGVTDLSRPGWLDLLVTPGITFVEPVGGTASVDLGGLTASATGTRVVPATATSALGGLAASAAGSRTTDGSATTSLGMLAGAAAGTRITAGSAAGVLGSLATAAAGTPTTAGSAAGILGELSATVTGLRTATGSAAASLSALVATASARPQILAEASADLGGVSGTATGTRTTAGPADSDLGGLTSASAGTRVAEGLLAAPLGSLTALATGDITATATATASLGALTSAAAGQRATGGSASANLGGLAATVSVIPTGAASADLGALTSAAAGEVDHPGVSVAPLGHLSASSSGQREVLALVAAPLGSLTGSTAGTRTTEGSASVVLGGLLALANGDGVAIITGSAATDLGGLQAFGQGTGFLPDVIPHAGRPVVVGGVSAGHPVVVSGVAAGLPVVVELVAAGQPERLTA